MGEGLRIDDFGGIEVLDFQEGFPCEKRNPRVITANWGHRTPHPFCV